MNENEKCCCVCTCTLCSYICRYIHIYNCEKNKSKECMHFLTVNQIKPLSVLLCVLVSPCERFLILKCDVHEGT